MCGLLGDFVLAGVYDGVRFHSAAFATTHGVGALSVHCDQNRANESGVTSDCLVVHEPDVNESTISLDFVEWV